MIYGFDTSDESVATAALVLYVVYRSRDRARFKVTPDLWGQVERFLKDSAKRAETIGDMVEALKSPRRLCAPTLHPRYMDVGVQGEVPLTVFRNEDGTVSHFVRFSADRTAGNRQFGLHVLERADQGAVIARAYGNTALVVMVVRDRLERERPVAQLLEDAVEEDAA